MRAGLKKSYAKASAFKESETALRLRSGTELISLRNGEVSFLKNLSKHNLSRPPGGIIVKPLTNQPQEVDAAAIGGRKMQYFDLLSLIHVLQLSNRYLGRSPLLLISRGEVSSRLR